MKASVECLRWRRDSTEDQRKDPPTIKLLKSPQKKKQSSAQKKQNETVALVLTEDNKEKERKNTWTYYLKDEYSKSIAVTVEDRLEKKGDASDKIMKWLC